MISYICITIYKDPLQVFNSYAEVRWYLFMKERKPIVFGVLAKPTVNFPLFWLNFNYTHQNLVSLLRLNITPSINAKGIHVKSRIL